VLMVVQRSPQRQLTRFQNPVSTMNEDGTMANNENSNSITLDTIAQMIKDQGEGVKKSIDEVRNSMDNAIMQLSTRIKGVEAAITTQRCRTDALQKDVLGLRNDLQAVRSTIHTSVTEMEDVIREGQLRFTKQCNLVWYGMVWYCLLILIDVAIGLYNRIIIYK
jgi:gas vesicle protein